jgi:hypothetical protein
MASRKNTQSKAGPFLPDAEYDKLTGFARAKAAVIGAAWAHSWGCLVRPEPGTNQEKAIERLRALTPAELEEWRKAPGWGVRAFEAIVAMTPEGGGARSATPLNETLFNMSCSGRDDAVLLKRALSPDGAADIRQLFLCAERAVSEEGRGRASWASAFAWLRGQVVEQPWAEALEQAWAMGAARRVAVRVAEDGALNETQAHEAWAALRVFKKGGVDFWETPRGSGHEGCVWQILARKMPALIGWLEGEGEINKPLEGGRLTQSLLQEGLSNPEGLISFDWAAPRRWPGAAAWDERMSEVEREPSGGLQWTKARAWRDVLGARPPVESEEELARPDNPFTQMLISTGDGRGMRGATEEERQARGAGLRLWLEWGGKAPEHSLNSLQLASSLSVADARALAEQGLIDFSAKKAKAEGRQAPLAELYERARKEWQRGQVRRRDANPTGIEELDEAALAALAAAGARDEDLDADGELIIHRAIGDRFIGFAMALARSGACALSQPNSRGRTAAELAISAVGTHRDPRSRHMFVELACEALANGAELRLEDKRRALEAAAKWSGSKEIKEIRESAQLRAWLERFELEVNVLSGPAGDAQSAKKNGAGGKKSEKITPEPSAAQELAGALSARRAAIEATETAEPAETDGARSRKGHGSKRL